MDYRDNRQRWAESHQVVHFYAGQWCTFTPALTVSHGRYVTFQLAEVTVPRALFAEILRLIDGLRPAPLPP